MLCRLCLTDTDLIDAHVIPGGFFRRFDHGAREPRLFSTGDYPRRIPKGVYDPRILCGTCEPRFGPWDQHGLEILADELPHAIEHRVDGEVVAYEIADWRYDLLKLFFVSVLWRAAVATHAMYERVELGRFEVVARTMLLKDEPGLPEDFGPVITKFDGSRGRAIVEPRRIRHDGINYQRFDLGLYSADIKTDRRESPPWLRPVVLSPGRPLIVLAGDLAARRDFLAMGGLFRNPRNKDYLPSRGEPVKVKAE